MIRDALATLAVGVVGFGLVVGLAGLAHRPGDGPAVTYGCAPGTATYPTAECAELWP